MSVIVANFARAQTPMHGGGADVGDDGRSTCIAGQPGMIVHTYGPAWDSIDLSPFAVKLQTWLRMANLPFETRVSSPAKMPQRKLPVLQVGSELMADSTVIIDTLRQRHGDPLGDAARPFADRAVARAMQSLCETDLYFINVWFRWKQDANFARVNSVMTAYLGHLGVPRWVAPLAMRHIRRNMLAQLNAQGAGRRDASQAAEVGCSALAAVSDYLADKPYLLGDAPSTVDATVFGFLHTLLAAPIESPLKAFALERRNLVGYQARVLSRYWADRPRSHAAV
jgi:glutathione S-transferase